MIQRAERNYYLEIFINLFTRSSDKDTEFEDYLYNKYTDEKILCKHYLYEVNIGNDNDVFNTMKSKFGLPAEDGSISCCICGGYLCSEDSTLFDETILEEFIHEDDLYYIYEGSGEITYIQNSND